MFADHAIKLINRQLSWLTGSLTCLRAFTHFYALLRAFTRFYALLRVFTRFYALLRAFTRLIHRQFTFTRFQDYTFHGYTVFKFYPLSLRYRDPAASPLNARQYMFENRAIKLINRQLSWLTGSLTCLRAFTRFYALLSQLSNLLRLLRLQFTPFGI